jgi:chaperonin GroEL
MQNRTFGSHVVASRLRANAGGGVALLYASKNLDAVREKLAVFDQQIGVQIIQTALRVPCKTIADNAGVEGAVVVGKLLESTDPSHGYNAAIGGSPVPCVHR